MTYQYHEGEQAMQERFDSQRLAAAMQNKVVRDSINAGDKRFIEERDMFFLASVSADGNVDCSYKGGEPGFVKVLDEHTIAFPNYDGNGMFMSTGNILTNAKVGLLFIDFWNQWRMRLNGRASIDFADPLMAEWPEAMFVVRVHAEEVFPNCPRYIHKMELVERSGFVPKAACRTPEPDWKDHFEEDLPAAQQERRAALREQGEL